MGLALVLLTSCPGWSSPDPTWPHPGVLLRRGRCRRPPAPAPLPLPSRRPASSVVPGSQPSPAVRAPFLCAPTTPVCNELHTIYLLPKNLWPFEGQHPIRELSLGEDDAREPWVSRGSSAPAGPDSTCLFTEAALKAQQRRRRHLGTATVLCARGKASAG